MSVVGCYPHNTCAQLFHHFQIFVHTHQLFVTGNRISIIKDNLKRVEELCEGFDFLHRINKWTIVNYHAIKHIETDKAKRLLQVIFKDGLTDDKPEMTDKFFSVNRNNAKSFREWFERQKTKLLANI